MKIRRSILLLLSLIFVAYEAQAFDVRLLFNNKETVSHELYRRDYSGLNYWLNHHSFAEEELKEKSIEALQRMAKSIEQKDQRCDLGIAETLRREARSLKLLERVEDFQPWLVFLRDQDLIDDIFYRILSNSSEVNRRLIEIEASDSTYDYPLTGDDKLQARYKDFKLWPDEMSRCSIDLFGKLVYAESYRSNRSRDKSVGRLNFQAYRSGVITQKTFEKLEVLRYHGVLDWDIYAKRYLQIVRNAKDKLTDKPELQSENDYSATYATRRAGLTRRARIYKTFDSTQIMMLAQLIEKTAKRLDAKHVHLYFQYTDNPQGESETYIFSPMEQYRVAIKLLRKDMAELMRSETFRNTGVSYDDVIAAAFETGMVKSDDLDEIVKFEDLWNPKTPRWRGLINFTFQVAGTAAFFLPPPWNYLSAIGLIFTQSALAGRRPADPDDNWNVII